jgi:hypothetical protein
MIDNPENGHKPDMRDQEAPDLKTATAVAEPDAQISQAPRHIPATSSQAPTPMSEPTTAEPLPAATAPVSETDFTSELTKFRRSFEEIQAEFLGEPRAAVKKAETLIDRLVNALHEQLQRIHSSIKTETDTEELRVAMLSYRELFDSLGGHRAA